MSSTSWKTALTGVCIAAVLALGSGTAAAQDQSLKEMMQDNFAGLTKILVNMITGHYESIPDDLKLIQEHAQHLPDSIPASAQQHREQFLGYAYNLQSITRNFQTVVQELKQHEMESGAAGRVDYLRDVAAAHYGDMVTTCVACHNQFRRKAVN